MRGSPEKLALCRARAQSLHQRAVALASAFNRRPARERAEAIVLRIEDELEWLSQLDASAAVPRISDFLPKTRNCLDRLEDLFRREGADAILRPDFDGALD